MPFEEQTANPADRTKEKYKALVNRFRLRGWLAQLSTLQIGYRGLLDITMQSEQKLQNLHPRGSQALQSLNASLHKLIRIAIGCSFAIWCKRDNTD